MKFFGSSKKEKHRHNGNRISYGIGTAIIILLAFSCVVGADSFLNESDGTGGEYYDMVTPEYYTPSENEVKGAIETVTETVEVTDPSEDTAAADPSDETTTTAPAETTTLPPETSEASAPSETGETTAPAETTVPAETTTAPVKKHDPTPTATPMPSPTPVITEEPWEAIFYTVGEVNVRKGPGTEYEVIKTLKPGDAIETVGLTSNGWYHTVRDTYVAKSMVTSEPPATPTPVPEKTQAPKPKPTPTPKPKKSADPTPTPVPSSDGGNGGGSKDGMTLVGSDFRITFYGPDWAGAGTENRTTATGTTCAEGRTVAADWGVLTPGTKIYIENDPLGGDGYYVVEDKGYGVDGHSIDIFAEDGESRSTKYGYKVYIVN